MKKNIKGEEGTERCERVEEKLQHKRIKLSLGNRTKKMRK